MTTVILRTAARALTPLVVALSMFMLLRGHDAPGGGFIGGLIAGAAVVLHYLGHGPERRKQLLPVGFDTLLATGLLMAVGMGIIALLFGGHFLEGAVWEQDVPLIGELKVAASFAFDIGVFLVVLSAVIAIVEYLGEGAE